MALLLFLAACAPSLPPVPQVSFDGLSAPVADQWHQAQQLLEQQPTDASVNGRFAMLLHAYAQFPAADTLYQRARKLNPDNPDWPWYHGLLLRRMGSDDLARAAFAEAVRLDPANPAPALQLAISGDTDAGTDVPALLHRVISIAPHEGRAYLALGQHWLDKGQPEKAAQVLRLGLEKAGNFGALHYALASALRKTNGDAEAIAWQLNLFLRHKDARLDAADELPPAVRALNLVESGAQHAGRERLENAIREFEQRLSVQPHDGALHANLMVLHGRLLHFDAARVAYARAAQYLPEDASLHFAAGNIALLANQNVQAAAAFRRSLEYAPDFDEAQVQLGQANERLGHDAAAISHYRAVLARAPGNALAGALLARRLVIEGAFDDELLAGLQIADDAPQGWQWRIKAARLRRNGDLSGALVAARRGLELSVNARDHEVTELLQQDLLLLATDAQ